jgi:hypothetical protein
MAVSTLCQQQKLPSLCAYLSATVSRCQGICAAAASAVRNFSECIDKVGSLLRAQASDARNRRATEAMLFIRLAYTFNQDAYLAAFAKRLGLKGLVASTINLFRQVLMTAAIRTLEEDIPIVHQPVNVSKWPPSPISQTILCCNSCARWPIAL